MRRERLLAHRFVEFIPDVLEEGTLYVSIEYATVSHKCCCGCGFEVVTPLSPTDWKLTFDGETISLHPSIGNWNFKCQSHYWIREGKVKWAPRWSRNEIDAGRNWDRHEKGSYYQGRAADGATKNVSETAAKAKPPSRWQKFRAWWRLS